VFEPLQRPWRESEGRGRARRVAARVADGFVLKCKELLCVRECYPACLGAVGVVCGSAGADEAEAGREAVGVQQLGQACRRGGWVKGCFDAEHE
jgi:hypothetical protein